MIRRITFRIWYRRRCLYIPCLLCRLSLLNILRYLRVVSCVNLIYFLKRNIFFFPIREVWCYWKRIQKIYFSVGLNLNKLKSILGISFNIYYTIKIKQIMNILLINLLSPLIFLQDVHMAPHFISEKYVNQIANTLFTFFHI
jgi:hypothetical protein